MEEKQAAVVALVARATVGELLDVEDGEERVEVRARVAGTDAEWGGEHDGEEGTPEVDATREVLVVLFGGARGEERGGGAGSSSDVRREEGA